MRRPGPDLADMLCDTIGLLTCTNADVRRFFGTVRHRSELTHNPSVVGSSPTCPTPLTWANALHGLPRTGPRLQLRLQLTRRGSAVGPGALSRDGCGDGWPPRVPGLRVGGLPGFGDDVPLRAGQ